jgi:hypothetical protein
VVDVKLEQRIVVNQVEAFPSLRVRNASKQELWVSGIGQDLYSGIDCSVLDTNSGKPLVSKTAVGAARGVRGRYAETEAFLLAPRSGVGRYLGLPLRPAPGYDTILHVDKTLSSWANSDQGYRDKIHQNVVREFIFWGYVPLDPAIWPAEGAKEQPGAPAKPK